MGAMKRNGIFLQRLESQITRLTEELIRDLGTSPITGSAYDTAWLAFLKKADGVTPAYPHELERLLFMQNEDGSWGEYRIHYRGDRLINTLMATVVLKEWLTTDPVAYADYEGRINQALSYLWRESQYAFRFGETELGGLELLIPTLVKMATKRDLAIPTFYYEQIRQQLAAKMAKMGNNLDLAYSPYNTMAYEIEFFEDAVNLNLLEKAQEPNGSIWTSPSATAYLLQNKPNNPKAHAYLERMLKNCHKDGPPPFWPIEIFDIGFSLYHFIISGLLKDKPELINVLQPQRDTLVDGLRPDGCLATCESSPSDGEDTANVIFVLNQLGLRPDIAILKSFEENYCIRCFERERNPSVTTNARALLALSCYKTDLDYEHLTTKIIRFLAEQQIQGYYWMDKWNCSPYYATQLVLEALLQHNLEPVMRTRSLDWIRNTQRQTGGWGFYRVETTEETAHALESLLHYQNTPFAKKGDEEIIRRGIEFILMRLETETTEQWCVSLWIGKVLYAPVNVVKAAVLGALYSYYRQYLFD